MHQDFVDNSFDKFCDKETLKCCFTFEFDMPIVPLNIKESGAKRSFDPRIKLILSKDTKQLMVLVNINTYHIYTRKEPD